MLPMKSSARYQLLKRDVNVNVYPCITLAKISVAYYFVDEYLMKTANLIDFLGRKH